MKFYTIFLAMFMAMTQTACFKKEKKDPYKQGELVTWKFNEELIIKTELGQRRKHIPLDPPRAEKEFYRPHLEHYVGQFPIDYQPKKYPTLSKQEAKQIEPYKRDVTNWLEFDLMLNGSWIEPTDESINAPKALDHEDQVKVKVNYLSANSKHNTKEYFEKRMNGELDLKSNHKIGILSCFNSLKDNDWYCFSNSSNSKVSGLIVSDYINDTIIINYGEFSYGGISINCVLHKKHINQVGKIDQAIWRMLDAWNVSPN